MRATYEKWCHAEGVKPVSPQVLGRELRSRHHVDAIQSHGKRYYTNLTLLADQDEPEQTSWTDR